MTMTIAVPIDRCLADRRKLLRGVQRTYPRGYVDVLPAEQWPDDASITVPVFTDKQRKTLEQLGFHADES